MTAATTCPASADACLGCARLEDPSAATVTLLSGQEVCSWCPSWRFEAAERELEARAVLRMVDRDVRLAHLARVEAERGPEARRRLETVIMDLWERRRSASVSQPTTA